MDLDRSTLAKIDRKVLSGLGHDEGWKMVRVPTSDATWSAWKRYCDAFGTSMGRAIAALMQDELRSVVADLDGGPVFLSELQAEIAKRQGALDARERNLEIREKRLRAVTQTQHAAAAPRPSWFRSSRRRTGVGLCAG